MNVEIPTWIKHREQQKKTYMNVLKGNTPTHISTSIHFEYANTLVKMHENENSKEKRQTKLESIRRAIVTT